MQNDDTRRDLTITEPDDGATFKRMANIVEAGCVQLASAIQRNDSGAVSAARWVTNHWLDAHAIYHRLTLCNAAGSPLLRATRSLLIAKRETVIDLLREMTEDGKPPATRGAAGILLARLDTIVPASAD